jgi:hypothetical protein
MHWLFALLRNPWALLERSQQAYAGVDHVRATVGRKSRSLDRGTRRNQGPYNKAQECARRRRQIAKGMLQGVQWLKEG